MKRYVLPVLLTMLLMETSWICKAQDFEASYVDLLKKELRVLPYKDFTLSYSLLYDSLQKRYVFRAPKLQLDSVANARLSSKVNELARTTTISYRGTINFDNYTDDIFISSKAEGADKIFVTVEVLTQPRGGIDRFMKRWGSFLDSLKNIGEFDEKNVSPGSYVYLVVDVDGSLSCLDTSEVDHLLQQFIQDEKPWGPGIMSGRPVLQRVKMQVPSSGSDYGALRYRRYRGLQERIHLNGKEKIVCYGTKIPHQTGVSAILSAVYEHDRYISPVFHKGSLDELQQLVEFLEGRQVRASYYPYFHRIYFYTMDN